MSRIAGTCYIKVDGEQLVVEGSVNFPLLNVTRETKMGSTGVAGYSETDVTPSLSLSAFVPKDFPLEKLKQDNLTITAECANGMVYTLQGAYLVDQATYNPSDGNVTLTFNGEKSFIQQ
jgi:hypothetical protein